MKEADIARRNYYNDGIPSLFTKTIMSLPRPKIPFLLILLFIVDCIAQRPTPDLITVSNFLPRPSVLPNNTLATTQPIPPQVDMIDNSGVLPNPLRLLPIPNSLQIFRCNPKNTHSHPKTHKLLSQCRENTFCSSSGPTNGTCVPILCTRDEFPFGYGFGGGGSNTGGISISDPNVKLNELNLPIPVPTSRIRTSKKDRPKDLTTTMALPSRCDNGTFCPDDGSGCRLQSRIGSPCELGRDEQCAQPGNPESSPTTTDVADVPICLHLTCMYANATLNQPCIIENTTYITDLHTGDPNGDGEATYIMSVIKHNCRSPNHFFCDPDAAANPTCQPTKELKRDCRFDAECASGNCAPDTKNPKFNICSEPVGTSFRIAPWQWGATGFCIIGVMVAISILLTFIHRRHRHERYKELREYYHEQMTLRRSILALHATAAERYSDEKPNKKT